MRNLNRFILPSLLISLILVGAVYGRRAETPRSMPPSRGSGGWNSPRQREKPYVILVSFDGFRADYLDLFEAPNFKRVAQKGVRAEGLIPVFPSKTFPNHLSIVTGMYASRHGIVANSFYDSERQQGYSMSDRAAVQDGTWYRGEPIWVTAETQGMVTATYFWPGSEAAIGGIRPSYWKPYDDNASNQSRVDKVIEWLGFPVERRPHLLTLYFSDVDSAGHEFGPATPRVARAVLDVDHQLGRLLDGIERLGMRDQVYLILVSDHGMSETGPDRYVSIDTLIDVSRVKVADSGPFANLHVSGGPSEARAVRDDLNRKLEHGRAYLRADVPANLHYNGNKRIGDVVIIMEEHYQIGIGGRAPKSPGGAHGWTPDLTSMRGIFLAMGPGMKKGARIPLVKNIDINPLMIEILGLKASRMPRIIDGKPGLLRALRAKTTRQTPRSDRRHGT